MKNFLFSAAFCLCGAVLFADNDAPVKGPLFDWNLLWSGSWEESTSSVLKGSLKNRLEFKLDILPFDLTLRAQVLDRNTLNFNVDSFKWNEFFPEPEKQVTNLTGGLYHNPTGSRLLYGVFDEYGLPARIRNPWIRSPPYAENHDVSKVDIKNTSSSTKEDEVYLFLSSPVISIFSEMKIRGFFSAQTEVDELSPAFSGGVDLDFNKNTNLLLDLFYTQKTLPSSSVSTWFSDPPPLPRRDFRILAAGVLFSNQDFSAGFDFAFSETFAFGKDFYFNLGVTVTPALSFGGRDRPLSVSLAADGAGRRFVYRDGVIHGEGFRSSAKIEWRRRYNSVFRFDIVLRGPEFGVDFNRSSTGLYYRFPIGASNKNKLFRFTSVSLSFDRNAVNNLKVSDNFSGSFGMSISLRRIRINSPLGINISGSVKGLSAMDNPSLFPVFDDGWLWNEASAGFELSVSPGKFQFRTGLEYTAAAKKDGKFSFFVYASARFIHGRVSLKAESAEFPQKWNLSVSWRLEIP